MTYRFHVPGIPAPQGSKKIVGKLGQRGRLVESSKGVAPWRVAVSWAARIAREGRPPLDGPLALRLVFALPQPKRASRKAIAGGPCKKPDLDKLIRSTMDGLTDGGLWEDDSRVVRIEASKCYAFPPGVAVEVSVA